MNHNLNRTNHYSPHSNFELCEIFQYQTGLTVNADSLQILRTKFDFFDQTIPAPFQNPNAGEIGVIRQIVITSMFVYYYFGINVVKLTPGTYFNLPYTKLEFPIGATGFLEHSIFKYQ